MLLSALLFSAVAALGAEEKPPSDAKERHQDLWQGARCVHLDGEARRPQRISAARTDISARVPREEMSWFVIAGAVINERGRLESIRFHRTVSKAMRSELESDLATWRYEPYRIDGEPARVCLAISWNFHPR